MFDSVMFEEEVMIESVYFTNSNAMTGLQENEAS